MWRPAQEANLSPAVRRQTGWGGGRAVCEIRLISGSKGSCMPPLRQTPGTKQSPRKKGCLEGLS